MVRYRKVNGKVRAYSKWYDHQQYNVDYDVDNFKSKKELIAWFTSDKNATNYVTKLNKYIEPVVKEKKLKNIVSFGSGLCVQEYLLKQELPKDYNIVATDYNKDAVEKAQSYFPELICKVFDLKNDSVAELEKQLDMNIDFAFLVNSAYVMDDSRFVNFFKELNKCGVEYVLDASGGIIFNKRIIPWYLHRLINAGYYVLNGHLKYSESYIPGGRPFGYARTIPQLLRLYKSAGYTVINNYQEGNSRHIGLLKKTQDVK